MKHAFNQDLFQALGPMRSMTYRFALCKYGAGIIQMSGSIAGNTFSRNRYGNYVRAKTKPINPNTQLQQVVRSTIAYLTDRWSQTLTDEERLAWKLYADSVAMKNRLGESIFLSGFNHYIRSNSLRKRMGHTTIDSAPTLFEIPAADTSLAVVGNEGTQQLTITYDATMDWAKEDPGFIWFFQGSPQNAQRNFFNGPWRSVGGIVGIEGGGAITPAVVDVAFPIAEGQRQWLYARIDRKDGRLSQRFLCSSFVAA